MPILLILTILSTCYSGLDNNTDHAIYVSVIEIKESGKSNKTSLEMKLFADDLEDAIQNHSGIRTDLRNKDCKDSEALIINYFEDHFLLKINSKKIAIVFVSCELNDMSLWLDFQLDTPDKWQSVEIKADYLIELFPTQSNVVSIEYQDQKKMFRLTYEKTSKMVYFN